MSKKKRYKVFTNDLKVFESFLDYIYRKKYLHNILKKNDKSMPFYCIIIMSIDEKDLKKIIKKNFYNQIIIR